MSEPLATVAWHGVEMRAYRSDVPTLVHNLDRGRRRFAARTLLVAPEGTVSYADFAALVEGAVERLTEEGLQPGDRLAVAARNGLDAAVAIWACARGGFCYVGLPITLRAPQWAYMLAHSKAALALAQPEFAAELAGAGREAGLPDDRIRELGDHLTGRSRRWRDDAPMPEPTTTYGVIYTSGTTGRPKASRLAHLPTMQAAEFYRRTLDLGPDDRTAIHLPFYYVSGHVTQLNPVMLAGGAGVAMPDFSAHELVRVIQAQRITFLDVVPAMWPLLLRHPDFRAERMASLRVAAFGGAPTSPRTIAELRARLPGVRLYDVYGMTETAGVICCLPDDELAAKPGSVGRPIPVTDVRLVDDDGTDAPTGSPGEVWIRSPTVTPGYHADPAATAAAITDGWLHTGDYARRDDDGYLYVLDRKKDMIIRGGAKVYSMELENVLADHPGVAEAAVFGIPDELAYESIAAYVVPADGAAVDVADLQAWVRTRMAAHAVPRHVRVVDAIHRNRTGKIDKVALRAELIAELGRPAG